MAGKLKKKPTNRAARARIKTCLENEGNLAYLDERRLFVDKFTVCDFTCKAYLESYRKLRKTGTGSKDARINLDMRVIPGALSEFGCVVDRHILSLVFGSSNRRGSKSCKKLRDGIVHAMNAQDLEEMHERFAILVAAMDEFIARVQATEENQA